MSNPERLIDNNIGTSTTIGFANLPASLDFEFSSTYTFKSVLIASDWWSKRPKAGQIQSWNSSTSAWDTVKTLIINQEKMEDLHVQLKS